MSKHLTIDPGDITFAISDDGCVILMFRAPKYILTKPLTPEEVDAFILTLTKFRDQAAFNRAAQAQKVAT